MDLFIRRLPESVTKLDLIHFLSDTGSSYLSFLGIRPRAELVGCEIYKLVNRENNSVEFHGIAHIEPASAALAAIERLDLAPLKGKPMEVREFIHRAPIHDRRRNDRGARLPAHAIDNRKEIRRRENLVIEELHAGATSAEIVVPRMRIRHHHADAMG